MEKTMDTMMDATYWDDKYRARNAPWDADPNPHMARVATDLPPGTALDFGCGEGSDALWLAGRGWQVTAADISQVALDRGKAADQTGRVTWLQADMATWAPPAGAFDLVASHFVHLPSAEWAAYFRRLAGGVKVGGTLLIVSHDPSDLDTTAGRWRVPDFFYTANDVAAALDLADWAVSDNAAFPRGITDPQGLAITVHDTVFAARRLG